MGITHDFVYVPGGRTVDADKTGNNWNDDHEVTPDGDFVYLTVSRSFALTDHDKILVYDGSGTITLSPTPDIYPSFVISITGSGTVTIPGTAYA